MNIKEMSLEECARFYLTYLENWIKAIEERSDENARELQKAFDEFNKEIEVCTSETIIEGKDRKGKNILRTIYKFWPVVLNTRDRKNIEKESCGICYKNVDMIKVLLQDELQIYCPSGNTIESRHQRYLEVLNKIPKYSKQPTEEQKILLEIWKSKEMRAWLAYTMEMFMLVQTYRNEMRQKSNEQETKDNIEWEQKHKAIFNEYISLSTKRQPKIKLDIWCNYRDSKTGQIHHQIGDFLPFYSKENYYECGICRKPKSRDSDYDKETYRQYSRFKMS